MTFIELQGKDATGTYNILSTWVQQLKSKLQVSVVLLLKSKPPPVSNWRKSHDSVKHEQGGKLHFLWRFAKSHGIQTEDKTGHTHIAQVTSHAQTWGNNQG